jgi:hypothetical protein
MGENLFIALAEIISIDFEIKQPVYFSFKFAEKGSIANQS